MWLGADDDFGGTNLFGTDLYPNVLEHLSQLSPATGHPFTFYRDRGFSVVGVLPDVDGAGRHDILMAKRIRVARRLHDILHSNRHRTYVWSRTRIPLLFAVKRLRGIPWTAGRISPTGSVRYST